MKKKTIIKLIVLALFCLYGCGGEEEASVYTDQVALAIEEAGQLIFTGCVVGGILSGVLA